ncbi:MAG: SPOR domain-containing protein [Chitinophagaceae bacterium]|nr:MAG: SPOR domain-containing protein [Chitinophagaceae bacterium]
MRKLITVLAVLVSLNASAQIDSTDSSTVIVHKDPRLEQLVTLQAQINEETSRDARKTAKGYRLMIISTNSREEAIAAKTTIYTYFPDLQPYLWHQSPYYKVKAGNFRDRKDAEEYQKRLNVYFPKGVFVMNDIIEVKADKTRADDL